jgi:hypothetical protein
MKNLVCIYLRQVEKNLFYEILIFQNIMLRFGLNEDDLVFKTKHFL